MTSLAHDVDQIGWYAVLTQPNREKRVMEEFKRFGLYSFHPVEKRWRVRRLARKHPSGKVMPDGRTGYYVERSILPGYVFTKLPGIPRWHIIKDLPFISGVLGHNGAPIRLNFGDLKTLHELRQRSEELDGVKENMEVIVFRPGDQVRITENPALEGFVQEVMAVNANDETVYLRDLCILGKPLPIPYAQVVHV